MTDNGSNTEDGLLTAGCEHCDWATNASSHATLVEAYQDHLRDSHPKSGSERSQGSSRTFVNPSSRLSKRSYISGAFSSGSR
jgi:hypothetical protein